MPYNEENNLEGKALCLGMSLSITGNEKSQRFFSISGRSVSKGGTLLPRFGFTAPSEARVVMETRGNEKNPQERGRNSV